MVSPQEGQKWIAVVTVNFAEGEVSKLLKTFLKLLALYIAGTAVVYFIVNAAVSLIGFCQSFIRRQAIKRDVEANTTAAGRTVLSGDEVKNLNTKKYADEGK